ncbi:hypothetical protein SBV1_1860029 [Verrucomicrobia bacterium]|nr:hypothetical protein SBV1_1860029 [Verrucomicrobiota bacterium]
MRWRCPGNSSALRSARRCLKLQIRGTRGGAPRRLGFLHYPKQRFKGHANGVQRRSAMNEAIGARSGWLGFRVSLAFESGSKLRALHTFREVRPGRRRRLWVGVCPVR